jgi:hypothetical protein
VATDWLKGVGGLLVREDLQLCFAGNPKERFAGVGQLAMRLRALPQRRAEVAARKAELVRQEMERAERDELRRQAAQRRRIVRGGAKLAQNWRFEIGSGLLGLTAI